MSAVNSKRLGYAVLSLMVATLGFHATASARDGLPPIHESSIANAVAAPPPAPVFSERQLPLEQRLIRLERLVDNRALLEMLTRIEDMQVEVQMMRGELEMQRHEFEGIKQRQRDLYLDIDRRMLALEKSASSAPASTAGFAPRADVAVQSGLAVSAANTAASAPFASMPPIAAAVPALGGGSGQPPVVPVAAPVPAAIDPLKEQSAYQQALNILREGRYDEAIVAFQSFLSRFQGSQYAGNAQYWIGEANYVSLRYPLAVEEFQKVIANYPESSKVSGSLLKIGYTFYELKAWDQARQTLSTLVERFPKTTAAQLADNRLHRMKLEGH
ncbi:MAG: tol-pal system protein YbgF [Thiotrichaceae bacterium]|nr:tol-pal system protein YbgF [Thiotrichaceae bacterium]